MKVILIKCQVILGVCLFILPAMSYADGASASNWSVKKQQIQLSENVGTPLPFFGKGIIYEPIPIGFSGGSTFVDVYHKEWRALYKRDIPIMRSMGINTVRVYGFFGYPPTYGVDNSIPPTSNLYNTLKDNYTNCINSTTGEPLSDQTGCVSYWDNAPWDHSDFLDELWNGGKNPIYLLVGVDNESIGSFLPSDTTGGGNAQPTTGNVGYLGYKNYKNFYANLIAWIGRKYGDHPAILGFALFNEKNDGRWDVKPFWELIDGYANQIHADENLNGRLVGLALQTSAADVKDHMGNSNVLKSTVDFWGVNLYPISNYGQEYATYVTTYPDQAKPLLITEYGALSVTHSPSVAGWPGCGSSCPKGVETPSNEKNAGADITTNYNTATNPTYSFFNGFYYFEYSDEWWKMKKPGNPIANTQHLWIHDLGNVLTGGDSASGYWDEEWWGLLAAQRTGYDVTYARSDYENNHTAWIQGAEYYKTPPDYLIPRSQIATLMQLYTGDSGKTLADIPTQITFTLSNVTVGTTVAALYSYEETPDNEYQATYTIEAGKSAAVAMPANIKSFVIYNAGGNSWVPICENLASQITSQTGPILYVSESSGNFSCSFTKPMPPTVNCGDLTSKYKVYCEAIPNNNYGPALTWGCGSGGVDCSIIAPGGKYQNCSSSDRFTWMASRYYSQQSPQSPSDCSFSGVGKFVSGQ